MRSIKTLRDYVNAVRTAAGGKIFRYPQALHSVMLSRLRYGLGPRFHSLYNLIDVPQERWHEYLVDQRLRTVLRSINPTALREVVYDKLAFYDHCVTHSLPTIPILCAVQSREGESPKSVFSVQNESEWCIRLEKAPEKLFVKLIDGTGGVDAFVAIRQGDGWSYGGNQGSASAFYAFLKARKQHVGSNRGWIVQPVIETHQGLRQIASPNALPTIRANTYLINGAPTLLFAALRIPVGANVTDNFGHGSTGNVTAPIDTKTGKLGVCRGSVNRNWPEIVEVLAHPDTGILIKGFQIPMWGEVLDLLEKAQKSLPALRTLGWDIAITDSGPLIVEANATYDIDIIQVAYQKGVRPQIEEVFSSWSDKLYKVG